MTKEKKEQETLLAGIDVGSTTTKVAVIDPETGRILFSDYRRHHADQVKSIAFVLNALKEHFPGRKFQTALTGSGAKPIAEKLKLTFIQEVAANADRRAAMMTACRGSGEGHLWIPNICMYATRS